jgi:hypothetical protein
MGDHRHMGQSAHPGRPAGRFGASTAVFALAVGGLGALLTGCSSPVSSATTALRGVIAVTVVHTDGSTARGVNGLELQPGDVVRTGSGGRAELVTRDREVYVGSEAAMQVVAGDRQVLRHGAAVVNAQDAPGLSLQVADLTVAVPDGSAIRAERSVTVRVGTLAGTAGIVSGTGRQLTVPALHQTTVGGDALPDDSTPLRLTDDDGEARTVPDLVRDDRTLLGLARGMDSTGRATAQAVSQSLDGPPLPPKPSGAGRSERLLPAVIAAAADDDELYDRAVELRRAGGSWAVVARLLGVRAAGVVDALAALEKLQGPGDAPSPQDILDGIDDNPPDGNGNGGGDGPGDGDGNGGNGGGGGGGGGTPSPTASPTPTDDGGVVGTVTKTVRDVLSLVPTPSPTSSSPQPLVSLPGLPLVP